MKLTVERTLLKGKSHQRKGELEEARAVYAAVLEAFPNNKRAKLALASLDQPKEFDRLISLYSAGRTQDVIWEGTSLLEEFGSSFVLWDILGAAYNANGQVDYAIAAYERALSLKPDYADACYNIGVMLQGHGKLEHAIAAYERALSIKPDHAEAYNNMGNALKDQGKLEDAIAAYERALSIKADYVAAEAQMLSEKRHVCDFSISAILSDASAKLGITTEAVSPFDGLCWLDNPEHQLQRSRTWTAEKYKQSPLSLPTRSEIRPKRLKIGYFSADFHEHATMYLMAGLLRHHNAEQFEVFAYNYGRSKSDNWSKKTAGSVDHFFDIEGQSDSQISDLARDHGLDIAIDLKGYTTDTKSGIFQYRLAPIQINYLGYPGSMGADFIDYIIADPVVIAIDQRQFYSEKIIYLPHSYQPNDDTREIARTDTTRADFGLPENAFVFCCFNNNYKISPSEFDIWMRLLSKVDGSVLWLLKANKWAEQNLKREAQARGVNPDRLVFAEKVTHAEHLARHKHADLFVDTFNVNAHTTASDALWGGLPVVTKKGKQFAARVAASLLSAVGLPELIAETEEEYEKLILDLAMRPQRLSEIKAKLAENRLTEPLFDTPRYTQNFEKGLQKAYDLFFANEQPADIWVVDNELV
jgi:protein O-GlcNAc transferase